MTSDPALLRGVIPPLVTPVDERGEVDRESLARLIGFLLDAGVDGLFVGGSTGEVALLDSAARRALVEVAVSTAAGSVPVLAGAVDTGTRRVIEQGREAAGLGADAVVVTAPFYVAPNDAEIVAHYRAVAAAVDVPVIAYDIPSAVGVHLSPPVVAELAEAKLVVALKDSSGDLAGLRETLRLVRPGFPVLTGSELIADVSVALGASGIVPGLGNVDPHGYVRLYRAAAAGDLDAAKAEQDRLSRLFTIVSVADRTRIGFTAGALGSFKAALALRGVITHADTLPPLSPVTAAETTAIAEILAETGLSVA